MKRKLDKILSLLVCVSILMTSLVALASCQSDDDKNKEDENLYYLVENGETKFTIVRSDRAAATVVEIVKNFRTTINDKYGCEMPLISDWMKPGEESDPNAYEILIGDTNRPESQEIINSLEENSWAVELKGNKLIICATSDAMLSVAVEWFIENHVKGSSDKFGIPEDLSVKEGFGDALPISICGITSYKIAYTKGNTQLAYFASLIQRHTKLSGNALEVVTDDKASGDSLISISIDSSLGANEYKVTVDNTSINVTACDEETLYYGMNYFLEHGVKVTNTVVSVAKDYSLSGKLENYTSAKWQMSVPAMDYANISPVYDIGPGLEDDRAANTITDSYIHLASDVESSDVDAYAAKLESFGFKNVYSAKTDTNTLTCYRLGKAYVYLHYCPRRDALRIVWDKSSTAEVNDVDNVAKGNGTTTLYQYSLDYVGEGAALNFSGNGIDCGMLYIIKLSDNSLILVDSGHSAQSCEKSLQGLCDFLYEITGTHRSERLNIKFWYFTHPDGDHNELAPRLHDFMTSHGYKPFNVEAFGHAYPSARGNNNISKTDGSYAMINMMRNLYPNLKFLKLHTGMVFNIDEVKVEVISTVENFVGKNGKIPDGYDANDVCSVLRFSFDGMSVLMQGDQGAGTEKEQYLTRLYSSDFIASDMIQLAHHGYNDTAIMFGLCKSKYALCPNAGLVNGVKESLRKRAKIDADHIILAGNYIHSFQMVNGEIKVTQIMRYDNPDRNK